MPNPTIIQASLAIFLILSGNAFNNTVEANRYGGRRTMQKRIDSQSIIKALAGYDFSAVKHDRNRRVLADASRISPGGPDSIHD
ncbi:CLAVATA3/ESR-RELATED 6 [Hibiscus trionum]|uniref:CLAVATA3/ESR-RELATED 6 n=1 Tax=Hibiscus trionum TaxID=183268 RepID=A0A9W7M8R1_HIBTR|nr:CLAVATA3/ESR-RELATED 6 [Hibiscus trionum]